MSKEEAARLGGIGVVVGELVVVPHWDILTMASGRIWRIAKREGEEWEWCRESDLGVPVGSGGYDPTLGYRTERAAANAARRVWAKMRRKGG